jgi:hypothetical protein
MTSTVVPAKAVSPRMPRMILKRNKKVENQTWYFMAFSPEVTNIVATNYIVMMSPAVNGRGSEM